MVFYDLGVDLWFQDNWTIHFKYKKQEDCHKMFILAAEMNLYVLPAYCADHLNKYSVLSKYLSELNLNKLLKPDS